MEYLASVLEYLKEHPEVTWSGVGVAGVSALYVLITKLLAPLFRRDKGGNGNVNVSQKIKGNNNIVSGTGDVKVDRRVGDDT